MSNSISLDDTTLSQIDMLAAEGGFASGADLLRDLVAKQMTVREMRAAVSAGLSSPAHPLTEEMKENIRATMRGNSGS